MKLLGIIVIYYPETDELIDNIKSYISDIEHLLVWDNTPDRLIEKYYPAIQAIAPQKISIAGKGKNVGIGTALNHGVELLLSSPQYTHLVTFDQDSSFPEQGLSAMKLFVQNCKYNNVGIFAPNHRSGEHVAYADTSDYLTVKECITSGSIVPRDVFERGIRYNEKLFIDAVDFEFCYHLHTRFGLQTIVCTKATLQHQIGEVKRWCKGLWSHNYSAFRTYFLIRNQLWIWRKYPQLFGSSRLKYLITNYIIRRVIVVLLFESDKTRKLKSLIRGVWHGLCKTF